MKKREASFGLIFIVMLASLAIAGLWNSVPWIRDAVHYVLDPTAGALLNWHLTIGMLIIVILITFVTTLIQKYATDQDALKALKAEQKKLQEEMKQFRDNQAKVIELQKKQFEFMPKMMKLSMGSIIYTSIPFILFFRWFMDFFSAMGNPKFFGFLTWFWFYMISMLIVSGFIRKFMKVV